MDGEKKGEGRGHKEGLRLILSSIQMRSLNPTLTLIRFGLTLVLTPSQRVLVCVTSPRRNIDLDEHLTLLSLFHHFHSVLSFNFYHHKRLYPSLERRNRSWSLRSEWKIWKYLFPIRSRRIYLFSKSLLAPFNR